MMCIKCGKPAESDANFCQKCLSDQYDLFRAESAKVRSCKTCGLYEIDKNKQWEKFKNDEEAALYIARKNIKSAGEIKETDFKVHNKGNTYFVEITCTGLIFVPGSKACVKKKETREISVNFKRLNCDICAKLSGNYYEALIQLRGDNADALLKNLKKLTEPKDIVKINSNRSGHDVSIMFKKKATRIFNVIRKNKIVKEVKKSYKLKGEKKGKKLYRNYYSIR